MSEGRLKVCADCMDPRLNRAFTINGTDTLWPFMVAPVDVDDYLQDGWIVTLHDHKGTR